MFNPISCGICIARLGLKVQGYDPRSMIKACAWQTLKAGKGARSFKRCLEKKLRGAVKDLRNPEAVVNDIYNKIKRKCS